jgi:hypothetical protein
MAIARGNRYFLQSRLQTEKQDNMYAEKTKRKVDDNLPVARGHGYFLRSRLQTEEQEQGEKMSAKEKSKEGDEEHVKKM